MLVLTIADFVLISAFVSLICVPLGIMSPAVEIKICIITARIKMYYSILRKKKKKHDKIVLQGKTKLDTIKILISLSLIGSQICHD